MRPWREIWVTRWVERRVEALLPEVVRRVLEGAEPQPERVSRRWATVVSADIDTDAGVGAVWIVWWPGSAWARECIEHLEWYRGQWRNTGGSGGSVDDDPAAVGAVDVLEVSDGGGVRSAAFRDSPPRSLAEIPWVGCSVVRVGPDVAQLLVGDRRIEVPERRALVVAWAAPPDCHPVRPVVVALGRDGAELSRMGPHDVLDTYTWARLRDELRDET
ncbi:hypothetical protein ACQB60_13665 [Actinomycetota bacterium Odt1-20B]